MKKTAGYIMMVILFAGFTKAQQSSVILVDENFVSAYKCVHPEFFSMTDSNFLKHTLEKSYIMPLAYADTARKTGLDKDPAVKNQLETVKKMAEDAYLALLWQKNAEKNTTVADAEIKKYYNENPQLYTERGTLSYLQARIMDTSAGNVKKATDLLLSYSKKDTVLDNFMIMAQGKYFINFEKRPLMPGRDLMEKDLKNAKQGEIAGPFSQANMKILYFIISKTPERIKPFEEVKEQCKKDVITAKVNQADQEFRKKVTAKYKIRFDQEFFSRKK